MNDLNKYFEYKCWKGLEERGLQDKQVYREKLKYEIDIILKMGFPGYFLIVQDFITWARRNNIYVGPGRGSAAGSLVSYCLGITNLDPLRWDLLFERFLNPDRISMPDIDVDFEKRWRDRVIEYVAQKYGRERVAHIGTFGKQRAKAAVRSVCKTLGFPYAIGDKLSKLLLAPVHGKPQTLATSLEKVKDLRDLYESDGAESDILKWAEKLEDSVSNAGVHASGIVVSNTILTEDVPLFRGRGGEITTQWEMNNIERVGLIKFDFLGLDALEKIHRCVDFIKERHNIDVNIDNIDLEDEAVFAKLREGDTVGIFQLEASSGIRDLLVQIRPMSVEDLIVTVSIYRPGPLDAEYKDTYLGVKAGRNDPVYLVPELEPILKRTEGWLIYQEQAMQIAKELCGYSGGEADSLRKAIGKKKEKLMAEHESKFKSGWEANGLPKDKGAILWEQLKAFASYSFNRSHAASYAYITYQTAWLKTHYPTEFMCAVMVCEADNHDDIIKCLTECRRLGIQVLPPDINSSDISFTVSNNNTILFGLAPIKNLGASVNNILEERKIAGLFSSFKDFCDRVDLSKVNRKKVESLIKAGAFDRFGSTRASLLHAVELIWNYNDLVKSYRSKLETYEKKVAACEQRLIDIAEGKHSEKGNLLKPLSQPSLPVCPEYPELILVDEMSQNEIRKAEHELLGFYVSSHPLDSLAMTDISKKLNTVEDIKEMPSQSHISIAAVVTNSNEITTKKRQKMAFVVLEDLTGSIEAVCFPRMYEQHKELLEETVPLKVDGVIEVTEADDKRVTKIKVTNMSILDMGKTNAPQKLPVDVPAERAKDLMSLLYKHAGNFHEVDISLSLKDGTKVKVPTTVKIADCKGAFDRDLARIKDESKQS